MLSSPHMPDMGGQCAILHRDDGGTTFRLTRPDGEMEQTVYVVFPGVKLVYNDVHLAEYRTDMPSNQSAVLEIDHCREGRLECEVDGDYFYLAPGDVAIHRLGEQVREESYPTSHYHGVTIQLDLSQIPHCLSYLLADVDIQPAQLVKKFHLEQNLYFAFRQMPSMEHIFSELYNVPPSIRKGYMKVKMLELLLFLSSLEPERDRLEQRRFTARQVQLAKDVCALLTQQSDKRLTIPQLAERFGVSPSMLKSSFSGVYGMSIGAYIRSQRMHAAARLLQETDRTILDIAGQFGYENASKFAAAFADVMGVPPSQYRKQHFRNS